MKFCLASKVEKHVFIRARKSTYVLSVSSSRDSRACKSFKLMIKKLNLEKQQKCFWNHLFMKRNSVSKEKKQKNLNLSLEFPNVCGLRCWGGTTQNWK